MKLLNYIGEFFMFRWLYNKAKHGAENLSNRLDDYNFDRDDIDSHHDFGCTSYSSNDYYDSHDDFYEEQADYDMMDDDF